MPATRRSALPRFTSVIEGASYVPVCDLCHWIGSDRWSDADARRACRDHARGRRHREDSSAVARAEREDRT